MFGFEVFKLGRRMCNGTSLKPSQSQAKFATSTGLPGLLSNKRNTHRYDSDTSRARGCQASVLSGALGPIADRNKPGMELKKF